MLEKFFGAVTGSEAKTNWPLIILIMLMPLRNIQLQYLPNFGGGLNVINILFFLSVLHVMFNGRKPEVKPGLNKFLVWYIFTNIVALGFGYSFLSPNTAGLWNAMKDSLIPVFLVYVVQRSAVDIIQWRRIFLASMVPLPYFAKVVWSQYISVSSWHYSDNLRISGTFMDLGANEMGAFSVMMALVCIGCLITCWDFKKWRYAFIIALICALIGLLYSYSRGGYLAFIVGFAVIFFKYKNTKKLIMPILLIVIIGLFNLPPSIEERFSSIQPEKGQERDESAESRFVFWNLAFSNFYKSPLFGYGYHTAQDPRLNPFQMDTHNYFVKMLLERGLLGFFTFIVLLKIFWNLAKRNLRWEENDDMTNGMILGMCGVIMALVVGNMFGDRFSHYPIITNFWIFIGLISVIEINYMAKNIKNTPQHYDANKNYE
ncbi:MAG: O-antigen ligase family protein [Oceanospirillaceae bacterium]|nr:O-antigen ligase family protein [Oceanospirillaceae bacterium]MCP5335213.1 O-antigen ligase family protein [Oceanospirillaceae bacterium]